MLAENSTSTAEISKRLVNFCSPKSCFFIKVSARRVEDEAKLVAAYYPEPKRHLEQPNASAKIADTLQSTKKSHRVCSKNTGQKTCSPKSLLKRLFNVYLPQTKTLNHEKNTPIPGNRPIVGTCPVCRSQNRASASQTSATHSYWRNSFLLGTCRPCERRHWQHGVAAFPRRNRLYR